jgi:hypothetical protein
MYVVYVCGVYHKNPRKNPINKVTTLILGWFDSCNECSSPPPHTYHLLLVKLKVHITGIVGIADCDKLPVSPITCFSCIDNTLEDGKEKREIIHKTDQVPAA